MVGPFEVEHAEGQGEAEEEVEVDLAARISARLRGWWEGWVMRGVEVRWPEEREWETG